VAHWLAGIARRGELDKQPGHLIDLMATCVDLAGASYPKEVGSHNIYPMEGTSLLPAFEGKPLPERAIFWEHEGNRAMREGDWKLVAKYPAGKWELYNIVKAAPRCTIWPRPSRSGSARWSVNGKPGLPVATSSPGLGSRRMESMRKPARRASGKLRFLSFPSSGLGTL
jgi:hypothetical protein